MSNQASNESPVQDEELDVINSSIIDSSAGTNFEASASFQSVDVETDIERGE